MSIRITLKNKLSEIQKLKDVLVKFAKENKLPSENVHDLVLAIEEILCNIISYGYDDNNAHRIDVEIYIRDNTFIAKVKDDGKPFNPLEQPGLNINQPLEERPIGGMGISLVRKLMSDLEYKRDLTTNILVMKKNLEKSVSY